MVQNFVDGGAAVNQLCRAVDADLRVYEMALDEPTADFTAAPAMSDEDCALAMAYGMMAVEPGVDLLAVGEMGIANTTSAAALACALWGGEAAGLGRARHRRRRRRRSPTRSRWCERGVAAAPAARRATRSSCCARLGGRELAAIVGAVMAARRARVPVLLDGYAATAAASVLQAADPRALDHCLVGALLGRARPSPAARQLGKAPLLDLGMRLGEASGATLAIAVVKAALACHTGMATFAEARREQRGRV